MELQGRDNDLSEMHEHQRAALAFAGGSGEGADELPEWLSAS